MISELMEKVLLLGVGAASLTRDKIDDLVDELVKRGQMTREEGEVFIRDASGRARAESANLKEMATDTYQDTLRAMGVATRDHVDELDRRISVLEAKVYGTPPNLEESQTGFVATPSEEEAPS
ncbi:MAG: phasin family protein [Thermoleophilia bacterium]